MPKQPVNFDHLSELERQAAAVALVNDAAEGLGNADRAAKDRGIAKAVLRRQALKHSLKAQVAAGGMPLSDVVPPVPPR